MHFHNFGRGTLPHHKYEFICLISRSKEKIIEKLMHFHYIKSLQPTNDKGQKQIAIGHLSDSGDLKFGSKLKIMFSHRNNFMTFITGSGLLIFQNNLQKFP